MTAAWLPLPILGATAWVYGGFTLLVLVFLALDLGVFHRRAHAVQTREALLWTGVWIVTALLFAGVVYLLYENHWMGIGLDVPQLGGGARDVGGTEASHLYVTAWLVEKSLSVDNIFVIALIFTFFGVPAALQHRCLFWGILGALVLRGVMIALGATLVQTVEWITYVFGGLLVLTSIKMAMVKEEEVDPGHNPLVRLVRRFFLVSPSFDGTHFITRVNGRKAATPLLLALVAIEFSDVVFAVDSIPAVFAMTADPFLVFTSNVFAILGLRALYFALASFIRRFRWLKVALILVLFFVGMKMLLVHTAVAIDPGLSLLVVLGLLALGVLASLWVPVPAWLASRLPGPGGVLAGRRPEPEAERERPQPR